MESPPEAPDATVDAPSEEGSAAAAPSGGPRVVENTSERPQTVDTAREVPIATTSTSSDSASTAAAPPMDAGAPPTPSNLPGGEGLPEPPAASRWKLALFAGVGVAVVAGMVGVPLVLGPSTPPPLPFAADRLPARFGTVVRDPAPLGHEESARAYSRFATHCGGTDIFALAERIDQFYALEELATAIRDVDRTEAYLRCGKNLVQRSRGSVYGLTLAQDALPAPAATDGERRPGDVGRVSDAPPDDLLLVGAQVDTLVLDDRFVPHPHPGFRQLHCRAPEGQVCGSALAIGRLSASPYWMFGTGAALERYVDATDATDATARLDEKGVAAVEKLARDVSGYASSTVGGPNGRFSFNAFRLVPVWGQEASDARLALERKIAELGAYWATGTSNHGEGEARLEILARSGHDAREILSVLRDYRSALKHVDVDDVALQGSPAFHRWFSASVAMAKRALVDAEPTREDELITYVLELKATPEEGQAFYRFQREATDDARVRADLVHDLIEGRDPDEHTLREIGGRELWISVEQGLKDRHGRLAPPSAEQVPDMEGVPVPGGGALTRFPPSSMATPAGPLGQLPAPDDPLRDTARYAFRVPPSEAVTIVNEMKDLLSGAGWTVTLDSFVFGPEYVCERDGRRLLVRVEDNADELVLSFKPLP